jgi:hypothetical protein
MAWITAYMRHQNIGSFAGPTQFLGVESSQISAVAIAINGFQRTELVESGCQFERADIASMPYLVATLEVLEIAIVPISMGVAKQSDAFHPS